MRLIYRQQREGEHRVGVAQTQDMVTARRRQQTYIGKRAEDIDGFKIAIGRCDQKS